MKRNLIIFGIIFAISAFFFRSYLFGHKLLFPTNLLVAGYSPWNTERYPGWTNIPFKGLGSDNLFIFYPMKTLIRKAIDQKSLPLWTPYNFAGMPLFGDGQSAPMYPLTYLYLVPSLPDAFSVMVILVPTLAMLFTYGMLRHFKLTRLGALFGAVTFAFCGFMSVWMEENPAVSQSAIWLPLLVWMVDMLITRPKRRWFAAFTISTAIMMSSGFLQVCLYELFFVAAYAIFRIITLREHSSIKWQRLGMVTLAGTIGLLLISPYLAVTWEAYKLSPRDVVVVPETRSIFLVQWSHILSLFNPDWLGNPGTYNFFGVGSYYDKALFIGVIPFVFVLIGLFTKKSRWEKFFWWAVVVALFLGFSSPFTQWLFSLPIPILSSMLPSRIFYLSSFALSVIAAVIFDRERNSNYEGLRKTFRHVATVYLGIIIALEIFIISYYLEMGLPAYRAGSIAQTIRSFFVSQMKISEAYPRVMIRNISISILLTIVAAISLYVARRVKRVRIYIPIIIFLATVASAWYFAGKSFYFGERQFVFPSNPVIDELQKISGIDRVGFANDKSRIPSGSNVVYGLYSLEGLNPVFALRYGQLLKSAFNGGRLTNDIPRISVQFDLERASIDATTRPKINRLMSLLDMKYIVERKESGWYTRVFPAHTPVWEGEFFRIWKNPDTLPRAFIATNIKVMKDSQQIFSTLYDSNTNLRTTAIVEEPIPIPTSSSITASKDTVTIDAYRMNNVTITTHASVSGLLILTDTYAPGWHAVVDGIETPVYRTDFAFRGIPISGGDHKIFLYYWPGSLTLGIWAAGGGICLLIISLLFIRWPKGNAGVFPKTKYVRGMKL